MFCKHCGKQIADDSTFCQYCGGRQNSNIEQIAEQQRVKVELDGQLKASLAPEMPKFTWLKEFYKSHAALVMTYGLWFFVNLLLLINGEDRKGFWPHTYKYRERVAEHTHYDYIPWTGQTVEGKSWDLGPEMTKWDWDIDRYGWSEFLVYVVLIPFIIFIAFRIFKFFKNSGNQTIKFNPSEGLRKE